MTDFEKALYRLQFASIHLQEAIEQFVKDNPSVNYSYLVSFVLKVRDIFDEI